MPSSIDLAARLSAVVAAQQDILSAITDVDKALAVVVRSTPDMTGASGAVVEVVEGDALVYRAASGPAEKHVGLRLAMKDSLSGHAVRTGEMARSDDTELDPRVDIAACRAIGIRSMIIAPLLQPGAAIGALKVFAPRANAFKDLDAYVVQLMAGMCSSAILQGRAFERYRTLFERNVAGVFRTTLDGRFVDCNEALASYLGYTSREDLLSRETWDLYPERSDREKLLSTLDHAHALTNIRVKLKKKDGSHVMGVVNVSMIPAEGGAQILGTMVTEPDEQQWEVR
jgi:PAS domain S-box-containing protein